jgi:hypothetical protein
VPNVCIDETKNKNMKATALGLWYIQIPYNFLVDPYGTVVEPKIQVKKGKEYHYVWVDRKQRFLSSIPKLNYQEAMEFKKVFVD